MSTIFLSVSLERLSILHAERKNSPEIINKSFVILKLLATLEACRRAGIDAVSALQLKPIE
ncbi:hypothetical protein ABTE52_20115, partial [Acinetobacter baumannii]